MDQDSKRHGTGWLGPEVVFGLMFDIVEPDDVLLDVGIGTGSSSILFHKAGLQVWGMDLSEEMLRVCESKGFAADLRRHILLKTPWPYPAGGFDHVVSLGVLNHFRDLDRVFEEIARITRQSGVVGFTTERQEKGQGGHHGGRDEKGIERRSAADEDDGHFIHSDEYIEGLLEEASIALLKKLVFAAGRRKSTGDKILFNAHVGRKVKSVRR